MKPYWSGRVPPTSGCTDGVGRPSFCDRADRPMAEGCKRVVRVHDVVRGDRSACACPAKRLLWLILHCIMRYFCLLRRRAWAVGAFASSHSDLRSWGGRPLNQRTEGPRCAQTAKAARGRPLVRHTGKRAKPRLIVLESVREALLRPSGPTSKQRRQACCLATAAPSSMLQLPVPSGKHSPTRPGAAASAAQFMVRGAGGEERFPY
jgi:hypothetical protein